MIDENAFGILIAYFDIEDDEYRLDREPFVERFELFRTTLLEYLETTPPGENARAVHLGHALYVEVPEGDETESPMTWARSARRVLLDRGFVTTGAVTHGSRWVEEETSEAHLGFDQGREARVLHVSTPSEPFRRALYAEAATHAEDEGEAGGWGPGLYVDIEALDALGLKPKNAPTALRIAGATFYRTGA